MFSRPQPGEDVDDILKLQEEFLRSKSQPSVSVINKRKAENELRPNLVSESPQDASNKKSRSKFAVRRDHAVREDNASRSAGLGPTVLGEIQEKNVGVNVAVAPPRAAAQRGFPEAFVRDKELQGKGRSIFAQQVGKQCGVQEAQMESASEPRPIERAQKLFGDRSFILSGLEASRIHRENVDRLSGLSDDEIRAEQQKWASQLDPKLLEFVQSRRQKQDAHMETDEPAEKGAGEHGGGEPSSEARPEDTGIEELPPLAREANKWLHMDVVERDKLKWVGDIPPAKPIPPDQPYAARFDFQGMLLPYADEQVNVTRGLHHHGSEPERPGYSLEELFQLTRSSVLQQRVLALTSIANILDKTKMGHYDECLQEALVGRLLDSELFLLLRFSLDDNTETVVTAALQAVHNLLVSQVDEVCLDRALGCAGGLHQPSLFVPQEVQPGMEEEVKEEEAELRDHETLKLDVVKGALRTDLVPRLRYILEVLRPGPKAVIAVLEILTRLVRHSHDTTLAVTCCPRLVSTIVTHFVPRDWNSIVGGERPADMTAVYDVPLVEALKLLRTIACRSRSLASNLVHKHGVMEAIVSYVSVDPRECSLPHREALRLSLESLYLWQTLLAYNLATQPFTELYPVFMQLLQFHLSATSAADSSATFGHEHGTALVSLLEQAVRTAHAQDTSGSRNSPRTLGYDHVCGFVRLLEMCTAKWLAQLATSTELTFSAQKLTGAALNCLAACYSFHRMQASLDVVSRLEAVETMCGAQLLTFLRSASFERAAAAAKSSSCLLYQGAPGTDRDPAPLPSLGALMWGGQQLTPVLCPSSSVPLLQGLASFLTAAHTVHHGLDPQCVHLFLGSAPLLDYLRCVAHQASARLAAHWFTRFEVAMLTGVLRLAHIQACQQTSLFHHLALRLVTLMHTDEKHLLREVLSQVVFNPDFFKDCLLLTQDMAALQLKESTQLSPAGIRLQLMEGAINNLPVLWSSYERALGLAGVRPSSPLDVTGLTASERGAEPALPVDWAYLPILHLHSRGMAGESANPETTSLVTRALQWAMLVEWMRPAAISAVDVTGRFCHLATVFLAGSDLFLEPRVHALLAAGLAHLMRHNYKIKFPASFYDMYTLLLEQFAAVSYGDSLFGHFVLVPLQQRHPVSLRKLVWSEQAAVMRSLGTTLQQLMFPLAELLEPCETDPSLLASYLGCLVSGMVREQWSPVLHAVAVHHVATFIRLHQDTSVAQQLRVSIDRQASKELRSTLLEYAGPPV